MYTKTLCPHEAFVGEWVIFLVMVHNVGAEPAIPWVTLTLTPNGELVVIPSDTWTTDPHPMDPGECQVASWHVWFMAAGTYTVTIDDLPPQEIVVSAD